MLAEILLLACASMLTGNAAAQSVGVLVNFSGDSGGAPGSNPQGNLIQASDGNFYGTTCEGGANDVGTVFKVSAGGAYTLLHSFDTSDGGCPQAGVVQGTDGNFYGTTYQGGANNLGTIFKISSTGTYTLLHSFVSSSGDGEYPNGALVQGTDGNFYGTTCYLSGLPSGTIFKITSGGAFVQLQQETGCIGASLVQGTDGNFYGTTYDGGDAGRGSIFKMAPDGTFTLIYSFAGSPDDGGGPSAGLVQGSDGNFYGTTNQGGANGYGTIFKDIPSDGVHGLEVLHSFSSVQGSDTLSSLVQGSDGNFYGTTEMAGSKNVGTIYEISPGGTYTLLYTFTGFGLPDGGLVQGMDGNFYGTTIEGGANNSGTIFALQPASALAAPVALSFPSYVLPKASFTAGYSVANAYSQTLQQCFATNNAGDTTVWTGIKTGSATTANVGITAPATVGTYTYSLTCGGVESSVASVNVIAPSAPATAAVSAVSSPYGSAAPITVTATESGPYGAVTGGVVTFSVISPATGSFSPTSCTLSASGTCSVTYTPTGSLAAGTYTNDLHASFTAVGVYAAATGNSTLTIAGIQPATATVSAVAAGYGVTSGIAVTATESGTAGTTNGSVVTFGVTGAATGSFSPATCTIANGSCTTTYYPTGTLAFGIYANGITASFAATGNYLAANAANSLTIDGESVLLNFTGSTGAAPGGAALYSNLIQASDGNFYGTTLGGGANGIGAVFKLSAGGTYTLLHSFSTSDGKYPGAGLVQGTDGNFYGTTYAGGANGDGVFFKITANGVYTLLHSFSSATNDGEVPQAGVVQGTDGNFYGTTSSGGAHGFGTVFQITTGGTVTLLRSFTGTSTDGGSPLGGLVQGTDGNFYGTTYGGGQKGSGTAFAISSGGVFTLLHSFVSSTGDGQYPYGALVQGTDGNFYGTTNVGGAYGFGTVFKVTSGGTFTLLHSFANTTSDGISPYAGLVQGTDGNFYGTTDAGGANGAGTIFQITSNGTLTLLHSFSNSTSDGGAPESGLVQGMDGNFYGMTQQGGTGSDGIVYKLQPLTALAAPVVLSVPSSVVPQESFTLGYSVANTPASGTDVSTMQRCFATNTAGDTTGWTGVKTGLATTTDVSLTAPAALGSYTYTLTCGGVESGQVTLNVISPVAPTTAAVSAVSAPAASVAGVTVTATESGTSGVVTGGVVTFSTNGSATGTFSPATCTLNSAGTCTTTYLPTGSLSAGTYTNGIQASFAANNVYAAAVAESNLTITPTAPQTASVTALTVGYGVTSGFIVTALESGAAGTANGSVVTFGVTGAASGTFNPATCTIVNGACTTTYYPTGTLGFGTYPNDVTASFSAGGNYAAASGVSTLTVDGESVLANLTGTSGNIPGADPVDNLIQGSDGNFYGTTDTGGANGLGTVFKMSATGSSTVLHSFSTATTDGENPQAGLIQGTDGNLYGTTHSGGANGYGAVFKITSGGSFTLMHSFSTATTDGENPTADLVQGTDGNLYGTTVLGGANGHGTVFRISPTSPYTLTVLHSFAQNTADGGSPGAGLVQGADGNFYGTTAFGGSYGNGTVFKISAASPYTVTLLHSFNGGAGDGLNPATRLVQGADSNFYGSTPMGGANNHGIVYKISPTSPYTLTLLYSIGTSDGSRTTYTGLVAGSDGSFYGTTASGGNGTLFKITSSGTITGLHVFSQQPSDGNAPAGELVQGSDGNFYGTTSAGGTSGDGIVYKLQANPSLAGPIALTVPSTVVTGAQFTLGYAVANAYSQTLQQCAATNNAGDATGWAGIKTGLPTSTNATLTASATPGSYTYTLTCGGMESGQVTLNVIGGVTPATATVSSVNTTYGSTSSVTVTATEGGSSGAVTGGVVTFSVVNPATGSFSPATCTLSASGTCSVTYTPTGSLAAGTYPNDIQASFAAVGYYAAATANSTLTITGVAPNVSVSAVTVGFGATTGVTVTATEGGTAGAANGSTVTFGVTGFATGSFSPTTCTIASGSCTTTYYPTGTLAAGIYGNDITASFALSGQYAAANAASTLAIDGESLLVNFTGNAGAAPGNAPTIGNLIQGSDGNFYGMTSAGGTTGQGEIFKTSASGTFTLLHAFTGSASDGAAPVGSLVQGTDGNFYGITQNGGAKRDGTIFKIGASGTFTLLHSFTAATSDGLNPVAGLVQGTDGNFYGTTSNGGAYGDGTFFSISEGGTFTLLHSFSNATSDGEYPEAGLVQGTDGNFYGTTSGGGANGLGTVYSISSSGTLTLLHSFSSATSDGEYPYSALVQGTDGNFYGTTSGGGANGYGTVFKIGTGGTFTLLHSFSTASGDSQYPGYGLVQGADGNFYGTASGDGSSNNYGAVFQITPGGSFALLHSFTSPSGDGQIPEGSLVQGADGNFYGTTAGGGTDGYGVIFKLPSLAVSGPVALSVPFSVGAGAVFGLGYSVANTPASAPYVSTMQQCFATNNGGDTTGWAGVKTGLATITNAGLIAPSTPGAYTYTLTCGGMESSSVILNVVAATSNTSLQSDANPAAVNQSVVLTATVYSTSTVNAGTVSFSANSSPIQGCSAVPVSNAVATCTTSFSSPGTVSVFATYSGSASFAGSTSSAFSQAVNALTPTLTFTVPAHHTIDVPFTVAATTNSGGAIAYSVISGPASVSGSTVTLTGASGTVELMASLAAYGSYAAATQTASFKVVAGSVWLGNAAGSLSIFGSDGAALLNATGAGLGTIPTPLSEAFDSAGKLWVASSNGVSAFSANGTPFQSTAFIGGGITAPVSLAVDGSGLIWVANSNSTVSVLNNSGNALSPAIGYPATANGTPGGVCIDLSGNVWVTNQTAGTVTQIIGAATPAAPTSTALQNGTTGAKP